MALSTLSGIASHLQRGSETVGHMGRDGGSMHTKQLISLRVNGRPAEIKLVSLPALEDGEAVTLAGREKGGVFQALAMRNDATGAIYTLPTLATWLFGAVALMLGLLLLVVLVGVVFIGVGLAALYVAYQHQQALALLRAAPRPVVVGP